MKDLMMMKRWVATVAILAALAVVPARSVNYRVEGTLSAFYEDEGGVLVTRQVSIPSGDITDMRYEAAEMVQGSLHSPSNLTSICDQHELNVNGVIYLAALAESSLLVQQEVDSRLVFSSSQPYPAGCKALTLYRDPYREGYIYIIFENCAPFLVGVASGRTAPQNPRLNSKGKVLITEGFDEYMDMAGFFVYLDQGELVSEVITDNSQQIVFRPSQIGSCFELRDIHPFSRFSSSGSDLSVMVDCTSASGAALRYVLFYRYKDFQGVLAMPPIEITARGTPLSDGQRYVAIVDGESVFIEDTADPDLPAAQRIFDTQVQQIKFLSSGNITKLVTYLTGENLHFIDVPEFSASRGFSGEEVQEGTTVSCDPACPPTVEVMGDGFLAMAVWNSPYYNIMYRPLDFNSSTMPVTVQRVSAQPLRLAFTQTNFEIVTSPPPPPPTTPPPTTPTPLPTPAPTSVSETDTPATTTDTFPLVLVLGLAIGLPVVAVSATLGFLLVVCLCCCRKRKLKVPRNHSIESVNSYEARYMSTPTVSRDPAEQMELGQLPRSIIPRHTSQADSVSETQSESPSESDAQGTTPPPPSPDESEPEAPRTPQPPIQETEKGDHEMYPRPVSSASSGIDEPVLPSITPPLHLRVHTQESQRQGDSAVHSRSSSYTSIPTPGGSPNASFRRTIIRSNSGSSSNSVTVVISPPTPCHPVI